MDKLNMDPNSNQLDIKDNSAAIKWAKERLLELAHIIEDHFEKKENE